ncbi:MAG: hypothetical protein QOK05_1528 [Chloroflexota bacterium]|jgi:signal transduction histidine kinase/CHASE3 domain sensor protein/ActR/RegA family two-component response regulator|nr:hypothetical protein [Chloroflexota bacterium]
MTNRLSLRARAVLLVAVVLIVVTGVFATLRQLGQEQADLSRAAVQIAAFENANNDLDESMLNQETGVRGYALTANTVYLQPYDAGKAGAASARRILDGSAAASSRGLLQTEEAAAGAWQTWASGRIAAVATNGAGTTADDVNGKALFDAYRASEADLDAFNLNARATLGNSIADRLGQQQLVRELGWVVIVAVQLGLAVLIFRSILRPLRQQENFVARLDSREALVVPGLGRRDEVGHLANALSDLQENLRERRRLAEATIEVSGQAELDEVLRRALRRMTELLDADETVCSVITESGRRIAGSHNGLFEANEEITQVTAGDAALALNTTVISSTAETVPGPVRTRLEEGGFDSLIVIPMLSGGEAVGNMTCIRRIGREPFDLVDARRAEVLVPFIASAVKVAMLIAELRQANLVKTRFLANMSHELRTPLNAILGFSQVLTAGDFGPLNETQSRYTGHIEHSGWRLLDLINDILDMAKVEAGLMDVNTEPVELTPLLLDARSQTDRQAHTKGLTLTYESPDGLWVRADPRRLQQVVLNLLSNAIKFTPAGGTIRVVAEARAGDQVAVSVLDNGIGVAPEDQVRIFDEFAQADHDESREHKGTGLGLSLSRKLTELMGGTLTLESEPGRGSHFTVLLPAAVARETASGPLVLVIEDEAPNREYLTTVLDQAGYRTASAVDVAGSMRSVKRNRPDVILLDIRLPGADGWSLLEQLKARPDLQHIPVIVITALDEPPLEHVGALAGFMTKPIDRDELVTVMDRALGKVVAAGQPH